MRGHTKRKHDSVTGVGRWINESSNSPDKDYSYEAMLAHLIDGHAGT